MSTSRRGAWRADLSRDLVRPFVLIAAAAALLAPPRGEAQRRVPTGDPQHPKIKYADSLVSLNDRCMVRKSKLNPRVRPVYVNWQPVGFC